MPKESPYTVLVHELPLHRAFDIAGPLVAEWLKGFPVRDVLDAPDGDPAAGEGHAELDLYADGHHAFAAGKFTGKVTVACSRCVTAVVLPIEESLRVTFMPKAELPVDDADPADGEDGVEVATGQLDVFPFDGERIELEPLFREQFVLAVPYAPLCKDDCLGLCAQCGIDKNTSTCTCEKPVDPRFAGLRGLKLPS